MSLRTPNCPACRAALVKTAEGELDTWVCPSGHGLAMTLSEAHGRLQDDEVAELWKLTRTIAVSAAARPCPMCEGPMDAVELPYDGDESREGDFGDGANLGSEWLDVCESCQVIWFDAGELDALPADRPNAEPTDTELAHVSEITAAFGQQIVDAAHNAEAQRLTERIYRRIARHPGLHDALEEVGSLGRR